MKYLPDFSIISKHFSELFAIAGLALLGYGLFLFEPFVGYSVAGFLLFAYGVTIDILSVVVSRRRAE